MAYQKLISACISTVLGLSWLFSLSVSAQRWQTSARQETGEIEIEGSSQVGEVVQQSETQQPSNTTREMKSFLDWCQNRDSLTPEAKYTVEVILERIRLQDCQQAHRKLLNQMILDLSNQSIEDLNPLSSLTHLEELDLAYNEIRELTPLSSLVNLRTLYLERGTSHTDRNIIKYGGTPLDLTPLASLTNLENLHFAGNVITNLTPLASLKNLRVLILVDIGFSGYSADIAAQYSRNIDLTSLSNLTDLQELQIVITPNIEDFTPLSSLINLRLLNLSESQVRDIVFLSSLINLEELYLIQNGIKDVAPLSNLTELQHLIIFSNQIKDITPISSLQNLLVLDLKSNKIQDITFLSSLNNLQVLKLYGNRNLPRRCPLPRESICVWDFN